MPNEQGSFELRIGLVMFGGLSLAVYMGGVSQELLHLVRASQRGEDANPYRALLQAAGAAVQIDVIAGTSAGGLNGLVLAKALATGTEPFAELNRLWRTEAQLDRLVRTESPRALLSGAVLEEGIRRILETMIEQYNPALADQVPVLDLFITATDLRGRAAASSLDLFGQTITQLRHQHQFRLRKRTPQHGRGYRWNDFYVDDDPGANPPRDAILAKVARATAAVPAAFPPQELTRAECRAAGLEHLLPENDPRPAIWFSDGGILMNKPFAPVLRTIFARSAERPVERVLLWVDPHPPDDAVLQDAGEPHLLESLGAVFSLPRSEDTVRYLERIEAQNRRRDAVREVMARVEAGPAAVSEAPLDVDGQLRRIHYLLLMVAEMAAPGSSLGGVKRHLWNAREDWTNARWLVSQAPGERENHLRQAALMAEGEVASALRAASGLLTRDGRVLGDVLEAAYRGYAARDLLLALILGHGSLPEWDRIRPGRIAPVATSRIRRGVKAKLAAEILGHLGGFLDERWRHSDILWGRLDAAERICDMVAAVAASQGRDVREAARAALEARHRQILLEELAILDLPKLEARASVRPGPAALAEVAAASQGTTAPIQVLWDYLTYDHRIGEEEIGAAQRAVLAAGVVGALGNLVRVLERGGGLGRVVAGVLRPLAWVARVWRGLWWG